MGNYLNKSKKVFTLLFPIILLITLLQNYHDIAAIMSGAYLNLTSHDGPIVLKVLKDFLFLILLFSGLWLGLKKKFMPLPVVALFVALIIYILFAISAYQNDLMTGLIGLRWALPFIVFLAMRDIARLIDPKAAVSWLLLGLSLCFLVQIYQLFYMPPVYGEIFMGLAARTPGIFLVPNSTAFFACSACACILGFGNDKKIHFIAVLLATIICLLAQSGTGIIVSSVLLVLVITGGFNASFVIICCVCVLIIFTNLNAITMRDDYVAISGGTRVEVFLRILANEFADVDNFGVFTNTSMLNQGAFAVDFVPDSLWASWFGNLGLLSIPLLFLLGFYVVFHMNRVNWSRAFPCILTFFGFSMTTIVFEAFPMNLYLSLGIWQVQVSYGQTSVVPVSLGQY